MKANEDSMTEHPMAMTRCSMRSASRQRCLSLAVRRLRKRGKDMKQAMW